LSRKIKILQFDAQNTLRLFVICDVSTHCIYRLSEWLRIQTTFMISYRFVDKYSSQDVRNRLLNLSLCSEDQRILVIWMELGSASCAGRDRQTDRQMVK